MTDIVVPTEQEGTQIVVKTWLKRVGDLVKVDDPVVEVETDKVAVEIAATVDGTISEILFDEGAEVELGTVLGRIAARVADQNQVSVSPERKISESVVAFAPTIDDDMPLSPGIRRMLAEHNLNPTQIPRRGVRLTREDIEAVIRPRETPGVRRMPHSGMRMRIAEHMTQSLKTAPHVTAVFEADFSAILAHRNVQRSAFEKAGAGLTLTAYFVVAAASAMKAAPQVNSRWYEDRIDIYEDVNVGIGTALGDKGLIVPVIRRAQSLSLFDIAMALTSLTEMARSGKLSPADVRGGTFSISNHGVSGSLLASPIIINQPQSAILGVGKLQKRVLVRDDDTLEVRPMAYVTLTIDHRVIDAYQTNAWLSHFVSTLQTWPVEVSP